GFFERLPEFVNRFSISLCSLRSSVHFIIIPAAEPVCEPRNLFCYIRKSFSHAGQRGKNRIPDREKSLRQMQSNVFELFKETFLSGHYIVLQIVSVPLIRLLQDRSKSNLLLLLER